MHEKDRVLIQSIYLDMWFKPPHRKHLTGGSEAVFRERPAAGGREADPPGHTRAICPNRPQFWYQSKIDAPNYKGETLT